MKKKQLIIIALLGMLCTASLLGKDRRIVFDHTYAVEDLDQAMLILRNINGSVTLKGSNSQAIQLHATLTFSSDDAEVLDQAEQQVGVEYVQQGKQHIFYVRNPFMEFVLERQDYCSNSEECLSSWELADFDFKVDFEVVLPKQMLTRVSTINQGFVEVSAMEGLVEATNVNGPIDIESHQVAKAITVNGDVNLTFSKRPQQKVESSTINGNIHLKMPKSASAEVRVKSFNGELSSDFDFTYSDRVTQNKLEEGAKSKYIIEKILAVHIGKGGPEMRLETFNGNIQISKL